MAATAYTVQAATHAGLVPVAYTIPTQTTGHTAPTGPDFGLFIKNGSGSSVNVDLHVPGTVDTIAVATPSGAAAPSRRVVVGIGQDAIIPLPADVYADATTGLVTFDVSVFTSLSIACVRIA